LQIFKLLEKIGEGSNGDVYKALHKQTKRLIAIKQLPFRSSSVSQTVNQIKVMKTLNNINTLKYYGCYKQEKTLWITMEYCDGGSVKDLLEEYQKKNEDEENKIFLSEELIGCISRQVLNGLNYLHSNNKIHRDIKAGNILLNTRGEAKISDFGISAQISDEKRTTQLGTSFWMAPECITGTGYDTKADIWSFGITLIEMAEGYPPLFDEKTNQVPNRIVQDPPPRLQNPDSWSKPFLDFVMRCLTKKPENRPTASQLLDHHFIVNSSVDALLPIMESKISKKKNLHLRRMAR